MASPSTTGTFPAARAGRRSLTITGFTHEVARARAFVAQALGPHPGTDIAVLLTSELVTNAVLHSDSRDGAGPVTVKVTRCRDWLRVEVTDAGSARSVPEVKRNPCASHGHGLLLVDSLAQEWGYCAGVSGTTVWFTLAAGPLGWPG
jgi:anti-sigma regulatory factor (Ser/Thr protein kinase)